MREASPVVHYITTLTVTRIKESILRLKMAGESTKTKAPRQKPSHPTFLKMAQDAISSLAESKGSSVQKIQTYISEKYNIDSDIVRVHLRPALARGLEKEIFIRPKNSDAKGYTGRFKVNRTKAATEEKEKARKEKEKMKMEKAKEKEKGKAKSVKKTPVKKKAGTKSAKSPKTKKGVTVSKAKKPVKKSPKKVAKAMKPKSSLKTPKKTAKQLKVSATPKPSKKKSPKK